MRCHELYVCRIMPTVTATSAMDWNGAPAAADVTSLLAPDVTSLLAPDVTSLRLLTPDVTSLLDSLRSTAVLKAV